MPLSLPSRRLRVLQVTPQYLPHMGGVENHVYQVSRRLAQAGIDVTVLTADPQGCLPVHERVDGVVIRRVRAWPSERDYYFAPGVYGAIREGAWDVIHVQSYHTLVPPLAMLGALRAGIPYVVTFHGGGHSSGWRNGMRRAQRRALRPLLARARRLVAVARFEIELYGRELGVPDDRFVLIPNGADLPAVTRQSLAPDRPWIATIGRLERYKGHHRVLQAMPYVLQRKPEARLWIAGTGPFEGELRAMARRLGVEDRVEIRAVPATDRAAMAEALSRMSLVVLLSEYETHPISALEALALGVPVLVADTSGLGELAERGLARAIPLASTPQQVADAVIDQLERPFRPDRLELSSWDDCAADLVELYSRIAEESYATIR